MYCVDDLLICFIITRTKRFIDEGQCSRLGSARAEPSLAFIKLWIVLGGGGGVDDLNTYTTISCAIK